MNALTTHTPTTRKSALVICPGRGTYGKDELGYLQRFHSDKSDFIAAMDAQRRDNQQLAISELDSRDKYRLSEHATGENASALIFTCALADYQSINRELYDIVAVTGNSMGWYLALAAGAACDLNTGMHIVNSMGTRMHKEATGGQLLYPLCDDNWQPDVQLKSVLTDTIARLQQLPECEISLSIDLGLMAVLAANQAGIKALLSALPKVQDRYPMVIPHHGAFHSPLMREISYKALQQFSSDMFRAPQIPMIDGRGRIWHQDNFEAQALHHYTFGTQVCESYNFSKAVEVGCKEFAPDCIIILGPGTTLGPPTAQQLIKMQWLNFGSKADFKQRQKEKPFVLSMGIEEQRRMVV